MIDSLPVKVPKMSKLSMIFSRRLRELCKQRASISQVAADLGVNRQQFARYLNGQTLPRQQSIDEIARYFSIEPGELFASDRASDSCNAHDPTGLMALTSLFQQAELDPISDRDLAPGFYAEVKRSHIENGKTLCTLVWIYKKNGAYLYKQKVTGRLWNDAENFSTQIVHDGVFIKKGGNLILIERTSTFNEMTFSVFRTSYHYNPNYKPGLHVVGNSENLFGTRSGRMYLRKLAPNESVLEFARNQGWIEDEDLPSHAKKLLDGKAMTYKGFIGA